MLDEMRVNHTSSESHSVFVSLSLCMVLSSCSHCCRSLYINKLTGTIPNSLGNLKSLDTL